jgi:hypothetical protein
LSRKRPTDRVKASRTSSSRSAGLGAARPART